MEWYTDFFRVLSLLVVWAIPAALVVAVVVFVIAAPALTLGGVVIRLYEIVRFRLRRRAPAEMPGLHLSCSIDADCPPGYVCVNGLCVPKKA
ncbi:MAG: dickkopf-related protein [Dehalococcoidales bacterium]